MGGASKLKAIASQSPPVYSFVLKLIFKGLIYMVRFTLYVTDSGDLATYITAKPCHPGHGPWVYEGSVQRTTISKSLTR